MGDVSKLKQLPEECLTREPEDVFDIMCKLGEGSYGSVYKALHRKSEHVVAIKQVRVDTDLHEIIKEISIMQQCTSPYVVKYYGSYFKNSDLWIIMEYCGAGSVSDIMRLRRETLSEDQISAVICDSLKGLYYLHSRCKIHRDIKAGNILLTCAGRAKLADFGVSSQLTDIRNKRNTVIGTPFWMAPEIIQEVGYDCLADIWSLGITALEMAEGRPPYGHLHPMKAIFVIPTKPAPSFKHIEKWSEQFIDFVHKCLVKDPAKRSSAIELLRHPFVVAAKSPSILYYVIADAIQIRENGSDSDNSSDDEADEVESNSDAPTMITYSNDPENSQFDDIQTGCQTMFIHGEKHDDVNKDNKDNREDITMKRDNSKDAGLTENYNPKFLDYLKNKDIKLNLELGKLLKQNQAQMTYENIPKSSKGVNNERKLNLGINQAAEDDEPNGNNEKFLPFDYLHQNFTYLRYLTYAELKERLTDLDAKMESDIAELTTRYENKRRPILAAIDVKERRQRRRQKTTDQLFRSP